MTDLRRRPPYSVAEPEKSLGDLLGRLTDDVGVLFQDHIQLAKEEAKVELKEAAAAAGLITGAGLAGWMAALMLTLAAAWGLAEVFDSTWPAFLAVGLVWAVVAGALWASGRNEMKKVDVKPRRTIQELQTDREWLSEQTN
ncbi:MAG TPA: phage holin family protein [Acidimicrobiia bacterium]